MATVPAASKVHANPARDSGPRAAASPLPRSEPQGLVQTALKKALDQVAPEIISLAGLILLLTVGRFVPEVLKFVSSQPAFEKWLKPTNLDLWTSRRAGVLYLRRAHRRARKEQGPREILGPFAEGVYLLNKSLAEAGLRHADTSRTQSLLDARDLAPLYSLQAWTTLWHKDSNLKYALASAERALRLDPDLVDARITRGWIKLRRNKPGDLPKAESDFLAVLRVGQRRGLRFIYAQFGYAETLRLSGEYGRAIEEYSSWLFDDPQTIGVSAGRGAAYYFSGNWQDAREDLTAALALEPDHPWARVFRADSLRMLGSLDEAVDDCKRVIERDPGNQDAHHFFGLTLYQQSQAQPPPAATRKHDLLEEAGKHLRIAKEIAAKHQRPVADILYRLAAVESELDDKVESRRLLKEARACTASSGVQTVAHAPDVQTLLPTVRDLLQFRTPEDVGKTLDEASELVRKEPGNALARYSAGLLHLMVAEDAADLQARSDHLDEAVHQLDAALKVSKDWAQPYYARALAHHWRGDLARVVEDCDLAIAADPNLADAYWLRAKICIARGETEQAGGDVDTAMRLVTEAIDRGPRDVARCVMRSEIQLYRGQLEAALQDAETALEVDENNATAGLFLSHALLRLEQFERALEEANRAVRLNPARSDAHMARGLADYHTGKAPEAVEAFTRVIELRPMDSAAAYLNRGWARLLAWDTKRTPAGLDLADEDFAVAAKEARSAASAYCGQAWVRYWQHQEGAETLDEAVRFSWQALEHDARLGLTHFVRGWIMTAKGQFTEAKKEFAAAIELGHDVADARYGLGEAERVLGELDAAIQSYTGAIEKAAPSGGGWRAHYGRALAHGRNRNWESAFDDYQSSLAGAKTSPITPSQWAGVYADFGWACYELGRDDEMERAFKGGLALDPKLVGLHLQMGGVRLYCGRYDDALACWSRAISLGPKSGIGYVNRGLTHVYRKDFAAAHADLETALSFDENDPFFWHTRGWAWLRQDKWKQAAADLDRAIELRSDEPFRFNDRALARWSLRQQRAAVEDLRKVLDIQVPKLAGSFPTRKREDPVTWGATAEDWSRAVARDAGDFLPYLGRGICRWSAGDLESARDDLDKARSIKPRSPEVRTVLDRVTDELAARPQ